MKQTGKRTTRVLAALLALLTLIPQETAAAVDSNVKDDANSAIWWSSILPENDGNGNYRDDGNWHRLVLEWGEYSTNSTDSEGNYADTSTDTEKSYPNVAWNNYPNRFALLDEGFFDCGPNYEKVLPQPDDWPGYNNFEHVTNGTKQRELDYSLYRNGECSETGGYSLYIKYAGLARDGQTPTYYISPCDSNGKREKKLWALDCTLNMSSTTQDTDPDYVPDKYEIFYDNKPLAPGIKNIVSGPDTWFRLQTPTFDEFEKKENFQYAELLIPWFFRAPFPSSSGMLYTAIARKDQKTNIGRIRMEYNDNNKWIFEYNEEDKSWALKSAGYISWDWSDPNGDFEKLFNDSDTEMANSIAAYIKILAWAKYASDPNRKDRYDDKEQRNIELLFYKIPWLCQTWVYFYSSPFTSMVPIIFMPEYAENVYITGGWEHKDNGSNLFDPGVLDRSVGADIETSYGMDYNLDVSLAQLEAWMDEDYNNKYTRYTKNMEPTTGNNTVQSSHTGEFPAEQVGVKAYEQSDTGEKTYYTLDEIKKTLPLSVSSNWKPTAGKGAFTGLYVGRTLETRVIGADSSELSLTAGESLSLGISDKNKDGMCEGAAYLFNPVAKAETISDSSGGKLVVEKGATLTIDGPTYAALGTSIVVRGSLIINTNASLTPEEVSGTDYENSANAGIALTIDGGSVYISRGAILDVRSGDITIKNGGSLINKGLFMQGISDINARIIYEDGGTIENDADAVFITGANSLNEMRRSLMRSTSQNFELSTMAGYVCNIQDNGILLWVTREEHQYVLPDISMRSTGNPNYFKNSGTAFISGGFKGDDEAHNRYYGTGTLYRARDLYSDSSISVRGASYTWHERYCMQSGETAYKDETLVAYYELSGIRVSGYVAEGDDKAETVALRENVIALRVGTGSTGTDSIASFKLTYVDSTATPTVHTEFIDPKNLAATYRLVSQWEKCGTEENQKGDSLLKPDGAEAPLSAENFPTGLEPLSTVTYVFQTAYPISYVESLSFEGSGSGAWTCTELSVYRVRYLYPLMEYGWRSENWYVPFTGTLLASAELTQEESGVRAFTYSWNSQEIVLGGEYYRLNVYEAPKEVSSKTDGSGFTYYNVSHESVPYSTYDGNYAISLSFADSSAAGIENYYNVAADLSFNDLLADSDWVEKVNEKIGLELQLVYLDTNGSVRKVILPFTRSAVEWAYSKMDDASKAANIHGLFQQGEDVVFAGALPDYKRAIEVYVGYKDVEDAQVAVTALSISRPSYIDVSVTEGMLQVYYPDTAVDYYVAPSTDGVIINNGQTMKVNTQTWNGVDSLRPQSTGSKYLVVVDTDAMSNAATVNDISISFTYKTLQNTTARTGTYSLRTAVNDYFGYWLSSDGTDDGCAYKTAVTAGGEMYFVVDIKDLYTFSSVSFTMSGKDYVDPLPAGEGEENPETVYPGYADSGKDEWQMSAITIYELSELGKREVKLGTGMSSSAGETNRIYFRDNRYGSRGAMNKGKGPLMLSVGQTKTLDFEQGGTISGGEGYTSQNKATRLKNLTFEETKQDFGFNSARVRYGITVKVKGTSITSAEDGDCGSKNQFYFQLVFLGDDGVLRKSPYTLSNQQLQSDGFRTGTEENFAIYTNDDYGTPVQINIIPDDTSSTSDVFDKLCIDWISVSKTSGNGVNLGWKASNVGWIDIEYKEDAEEQKGRDDEVLVRSFELKDDGYKLWVEFGIEMAADYMGDVQYVGQMTADITYRDSTGAVQVKENVAVVGAIADYANRVSEICKGEVNGTEISVPAYMFKKGVTNRFLVKFDDISSLEKIKLKITPSEATGIKISKIFARQVYDRGNLSLNIFNEYERYYTVTPQDLTATNNSSPISISPKGTTTSVTLDFNAGNTIRIDPEEEIEVEEGVSEGEYDYISVTAAMGAAETIDPSATLPVRVIYKNIYGDAYAATTTLVYDSGNGVFMTPQSDLPSTPNLAIPCKVEITGGALAGKTLKSVTVNQVRKGQCIDSFDFALTDGIKLSADIPVTISIEESQINELAKEKGYTTESQQVFLKLGTQTTKTLLTQSQDLQVALVYTEENDPYNYEHVSEYVSALDCGYTSLNSGSVLSIPMSVPDIASVRAVTLKTTNTSMKVEVEKGCIALNETSDLSDSVLFSGWVNLPTKTELITTAGTVMASDGQSLETARSATNRITPVNVSINLSKINRSDAVVKLSLYYKNKAGASQVLTCEKTAAEWNRDSVWLLAEGVQTMQYYRIETYDRDTTSSAGVTLSTLNISWYDSEGLAVSSGYSGNLALIEGTPAMDYVLTTKLSGTISSGDGQQQATLEANLVDSARTEYSILSFKGGGSVGVTANLPGCPEELELFLTNVATSESVIGTISEAPGTETLAYSISLPVNVGSETVRYALTVRSKTIPELYSALVYIDVAPAIRVEGIAQRSDGSIITGFSSMSAYSGISIVNEAALNPGETLTIYAKTVNDNSGLLYSLEPAAGSAYTVAVTPDCTLEGQSGTYTRYVLTAGTTAEATVCSFKVYSVANADVCYTLTFITAASGTE